MLAVSVFVAQPAAQRERVFDIFLFLSPVCQKLIVARRLVIFLFRRWVIYFPPARVQLLTGGVKTPFAILQRAGGGAGLIGFRGGGSPASAVAVRHVFIGAGARVH